MTVMELLASAYDRDRLGHALLFVSADERSEAFQKEILGFASLLLCTERKSGSKACGKCESCKLVSSNFPPVPHPDAIWLEPENPTGYTVEQIRELHSKFSLSLSLSPNRVIWLKSAELLSSAGGAPANAFLKILEEPRPRSFLILSTRQPESVIQTIRSRCQLFRFPKNTNEKSPPSDFESWQELFQWLEGGAEPKNSFRCPADTEEFWAERNTALIELESLQLQLWQALKDRWTGLEREGSLRVLDFFARFEAMMLKVRAYANPHLQWLSLRSDARLGALWKP